MILSLNWFLEVFATHLGKIPSVYGSCSPFGFKIQIFYKSLQNGIPEHFLLQSTVVLWQSFHAIFIKTFGKIETANAIFWKYFFKNKTIEFRETSQNFNSFSLFRKLLFSSFFISCLIELKFCKVSRNSISKWTWKFQLSILKNKKVLFLKKKF